MMGKNPGMAAKAVNDSVRVGDGRWSRSFYQAKIRLLGMLGTWLILLFNGLVRIRQLGFDRFLQTVAGSQPAVIVAWHENIFSSIYLHRRRRITILSSLSQDGDLISTILYNLGYSCVRGSSSRQGTRALLELVRELRCGKVAGLTVDGPRGPRRQVKPGAVLLSQKADALLVPVGLAYSNCFRFNSWDQTAIPLPGSTVAMVSGEPFRVPADLSVEQGCDLIRGKIEECEKQAEQIIKR